MDAGEAPARGAAVRIVRGLRNLIRGEDRARLSWERVVEAAGDRAVEWFELELPDEAAARETTLTVTVTDLLDGQRASASRTLTPGCGR